MIQDKISLILQDIAKQKEELKEIRKDIKNLEVISTEEFRELEKAAKDLRAQIKEYKDEWQRNLAEDPHYNKLREMRLDTEEKIAEKNGDLFELIEQLPPKIHEMKLTTEQGLMNIHIQPEMRIYLNGKEEKKRAA